MDCSQRMIQGSSVYFTNSRDCCSILEKLDFSRSPTMWGGTRKIRAISLIWNFRVSRNCACSGEMPIGVYFMPSSSTAILFAFPLPPKVDCQLSRTRCGSLIVPGCSNTPPGGGPIGKELCAVFLTGNRHANGVLCHSDGTVAHQAVKTQTGNVKHFGWVKIDR